MATIQGNRWVGLAILCIGFLMILLDTTIVNVSIPTIIRELNATLSQLEWVISGYALTFAAFLITFGRLGDMYGRKRLFILGLIIFTLASALCGEASSINVLIAFRLVQGVGGAMMSPTTLSIISTTFKGRERATAFGIWGALAGVAVALGPILGGIFTTYYSWRWIFRVNIPIGIIGIIASWLILEESKDPGEKRLDISGMITSSLGFFFLVFGLIEGQTYGWVTPAQDFVLGSFTWSHTRSISVIFLSFVLSFIFLFSFILLQAYKTKRKLQPAVNLEFFKLRTFRYGLIAIAIISLGEFSSLFTFPIFVQSVKGYTPLQSGYAVLPLALAVMIAAPISARIVNIIGSKWVISSGIFLEFCGLVLLSRLQVGWSYIELMIPLIVLGVGIGLAIAQNTQIILAEIPHRQAGSASGVLNTIRQVGTALGIAIIGAVLANQLASNIQSGIKNVPNLPASAQTQIINAVNSGGSAYGGTSQSSFSVPVPDAVKGNPQATAAFEAQVKETTAKVGDAINTALTKSIGTSIAYGSLFVLLGALLSLLIPSIKHEADDAVPAAH